MALPRHFVYRFGVTGQLVVLTVAWGVIARVGSRGVARSRWSIHNLRRGTDRRGYPRTGSARRVQSRWGRPGGTSQCQTGQFSQLNPVRGAVGGSGERGGVPAPAQRG